MTPSKTYPARKRKYYRRHRPRLLAESKVRQARKRKEFEAAWAKPDRCEGCGTKTARLCWDHNPRTGAFRGWLCHPSCNVILGHAKEDPERLRKLADYLEREATMADKAVKDGGQECPNKDAAGCLSQGHPKTGNVPTAWGQKDQNSAGEKLTGR